jgi:hypothetical protein
MSVLLLPATASANNSGSSGVLTLVFPLVFVFVVLAIWWVSLRRSRSRD